MFQSAVSGRSKCRACGRAIPTGEMRFGELSPNPYGEGESTYWYHLHCAACARPEPLLTSLTVTTEDIPERAWLQKKAEEGVAHPRLPRLAHAERSPSGRARCRHCRHFIEQGAWRLALHMFEEVRFAPIGFVHLTCGGAYFETRDLLDRIVRLTPDLSSEDMSELDRLLAEPASPDQPAPPGLAKTQGPPGSIELQRRGRPV
jgi:Poly(ADP-ribose) polymerase and DNA-Ligase Zn-finger region